MMTTTEKGNVAIFYISADLTERGFVVLTPSGEQPHYDLVIEKDGIFKKIQVKYSTEKNNIVRVKFFTTGHAGVSNFHTANMIDFVVVFEPKSKKIYYINRKKFNNIDTVLSLRTNKAKSNRTKDVNNASDFLDLRL